MFFPFYPSFTSSSRQVMFETFGESQLILVFDCLLACFFVCLFVCLMVGWLFLVGCFFLKGCDYFEKGPVPKIFFLRKI